MTSISTRINFILENEKEKLIKLNRTKRVMKIQKHGKHFIIN